MLRVRNSEPKEEAKQDKLLILDSEDDEEDEDGESDSSYYEQESADDYSYRFRMDTPDLTIKDNRPRMSLGESLRLQQKQISETPRVEKQNEDANANCSKGNCRVM